MIERPGGSSVSLKIRAAFRKQWYPNRNVLFLIFNAAYVFVFFEPLRELVLTSWHGDYFSYIPFIPGISAYLIYRQRRLIFSDQESHSAAGFFFAGPGILLLLVGINRQSMPAPNDYHALITCSAVAIWIGGFTLRYGTTALRAAAFPLFFLFLAVPIPGALFGRIVLFLQNGSAEAAYALFQLTGIPAAREGLVFHLPAFSIEVTKQYAGIQSSLALLIISLLAGRFFLRTRSAKTMLVLSIVPIALAKNALQIFFLSMPGVYADEGPLAGDLPLRGGAVFFALALVLVAAVVVLLTKMEKKLPPKGAKCLF